LTWPKIRDTKDPPPGIGPGGWRKMKHGKIATFAMACLVTSSCIGAYAIFLERFGQDWGSFAASMVALSFTIFFAVLVIITRKVENGEFCGYLIRSMAFADFIASAAFAASAVIAIHSGYVAGVGTSVANAFFIAFMGVIVMRLSPRATWFNAMCFIQFAAVFSALTLINTPWVAFAAALAIPALLIFGWIIGRDTPEQVGYYTLGTPAMREQKPQPPEQADSSPGDGNLWG
jgi:hypothetical protein